MDNKPTLKDIMTFGAERGAILGIYFCVLIALLIFEIYVPVLSLVVLAMIIWVPFLVYRWLKKSDKTTGGIFTISMLWLQGIALFFFASVILAVGVFVFLRFIQPDFMSDMVNFIMESAKAADNPALTQQASMLEQIISESGIPRAIDMALNLGWSAIFTGSILSLLLAVLVKSRRIPRTS